jgi:transposase InsO family protein
VKSFQELLKLLGVKLKLITAYHPQSDGTTEQFNQEIKAYISIYCSSQPEGWHKKIGTMEFTHNNQQHSDRAKTPFELIHGISPILIPTSFENTKFPSVEEQIKNLTRDRNEALAAHKLARTRWHNDGKTSLLHSKKDNKSGLTLETSE